MASPCVKHMLILYTRFKDEGAHVVIADFVEDVGKKTAEEIGCEFHLTNVTKKEDWVCVWLKLFFVSGVCESRC